MLNKYENLAFSGGSNKGYSFIGVMKYLEENKIEVKQISGVSIGSFFATLVCMEFSYKDLIPFINMSININDVSIDNLLDKYGFTEGNDIINIFKQIISIKYNPNITFADLYEKTKKTLYITSFCLNNQQIKYFNWETDPEMPIIMAIRLSISIPYIFTSNVYKNQHYIDGAVFEKISTSIFKSGKTLAFFLVDNSENIDYTEIKNIEDFSLSFLLCCKKKLQQPNPKIENTDLIEIVTENLNPIDFNISKETKLKLIKNGYVSIKKYFSIVQQLSSK